MSTTPKGPKKDAAQKLRDLYFKITKRPLSPENRKDLEEVFRKKEPTESAEPIKPKKIAKPDRDAGLI